MRDSLFFAQNMRKNAFFCKKGVAFSEKPCYNFFRIKQLMTIAPLAQLVEHLTLNQGAQGSSP
jgi:hypothetical protein